MLKNSYLRLLLILVLFTLAHHSFAMSEQTKLIMKDGRRISGTIKSLNPWSVTLKNGKFYAIKLMSQIITTERSAVDQLRSYYPELSFTQNDEEYVMQVADLQLRHLKGYNQPFVNRYFIMLNGMSARAENLEFQMNMLSNLNPKIVFRLAVATGLNFERDAVTLNAISLGIGGIKSYGTFSLLATLNLAEKTRMPDDISKLVPYFSFSAQSKILQQVLLSAGGRYYFDNLRVKDKVTGFSVNIGIGYNFQISLN